MSIFEDHLKSLNENTYREKQGISYLILIAIGLLIWFNPKFCSNGTNTTESQNDSSSGRYVVNKTVIYAATSPAAFDMMMNCVIRNDKTTLSQMLSSGDLIYLRQGDVVLLYKAQMKYYVVRREGSTQLLYVISELLTRK